MPLSSLLCFTGALLFLLGLLVGFAIPKMPIARLGLSAHLTGVQCGTALLVFGLVWPHLSFWSGWSVPLAHLLWISFYLIFAGMTLAAMWATGRVLPIAGGGVAGKPAQERITIAVLAIGSAGLALAVLAILIQWQWIG